MSPHPDDPKKCQTDSTGSADDNVEYIRDGWQLGFGVEINGVGRDIIIANDNEVESDSEGYEGPGDGSDAEEDAIRRAGYQQLAMNVPGGDIQAASDDEMEEKTDNSAEKDVDFDRIQQHVNIACPPPAGCVPSNVKNDFERALKTAESVHLKDSDFVAETSTKEIDLTEDKILQIQEAVNQIKLQPPSWAKDIDDEKLKQLLEKIKSTLA